MIQRKIPGSTDELKIAIIVGVLINLVLYNVTSLFELLKQKYIADF